MKFLKGIVYVSKFFSCTTVFEKIVHKIFLGQKHRHGVVKRHQVSYEKSLQIVFYKNKNKSYRSRQLGPAQRVQLLLCAKSSSDQEL